MLPVGILPSINIVHFNNNNVSLPSSNNASSIFTSTSTSTSTSSDFRGSLAWNFTIELFVMNSLINYSTDSWFLRSSSNSYIILLRGKLKIIYHIFYDGNDDTNDDDSRML